MSNFMKSFVSVEMGTWYVLFYIFYEIFQSTKLFLSFTTNLSDIICLFTN